MKELARIEAAYADINALLEQGRTDASPDRARQIEVRQILNDQAYFLLCWGQLEVAIDQVCRDAIRLRRSHPDWRARRGWDLYNPDDKRLSGLVFDNRVALVLDRSEGRGSPYAKTMMHYETRNQIAHGKLQSTRINIATAVRDFYVIQSALYRGI